MVPNFKNSNLFGVTEFISFLHTITYNATFTVREAARQHKPCKNSSYLYLKWIILRKFTIFFCHKTKKFCIKSSCPRKQWSPICVICRHSMSAVICQNLIFSLQIEQYWGFGIFPRLLGNGWASFSSVKTNVNSFMASYISDPYPGPL